MFRRASLPLALAIAALAACGGGSQAEAGRDSVPGPEVGDNRAQNDSAFRAADQTLDSASRAGVTPAQGIGDAAQRGVNAAANDTASDTNRLRARPD